MGWYGAGLLPKQRPSSLLTETEALENGDRAGEFELSLAAMVAKCPSDPDLVVASLLCAYRATLANRMSDYDHYRVPQQTNVHRCINKAITYMYLPATAIQSSRHVVSGSLSLITPK